MQYLIEELNSAYLTFEELTILRNSSKKKLLVVINETFEFINLGLIYCSTVGAASSFSLLFSSFSSLSPFCFSSSALSC